MGSPGPGSRARRGRGCPERAPGHRRGMGRWPRRRVSRRSEARALRAARPPLLCRPAPVVPPPAETGAMSDSESGWSPSPAKPKVRGEEARVGRARANARRGPGHRLKRPLSPPPRAAHARARTEGGRGLDWGPQAAPHARARRMRARADLLLSSPPPVPPRRPQGQARRRRPQETRPPGPVGGGQRVALAVARAQGRGAQARQSRPRRRGRLPEEDAVGAYPAAPRHVRGVDRAPDRAAVGARRRGDRAGRPRRVVRPRPVQNL